MLSPLVDSGDNKKIHNRMPVVHGGHVPLCATVKQQAAKFHRSRTSLEVEPCLGCLSVENIVKNGVSVQQVADTVGLSCTKHLLIIKVCVRWVPELFDKKMKDCRHEA